MTDINILCIYYYRLASTFNWFILYFFFSKKRGFIENIVVFRIILANIWRTWIIILNREYVDFSINDFLLVLNANGYFYLIFFLQIIYSESEIVFLLTLVSFFIISSNYYLINFYSSFNMFSFIRFSEVLRNFSVKNTLSFKFREEKTPIVNSPAREYIPEFLS